MARPIKRTHLAEPAQEKKTVVSAARTLDKNKKQRPSNENGTTKQLALQERKPESKIKPPTVTVISDDEGDDAAEDQVVT